MLFSAKRTLWVAIVFILTFYATISSANEPSLQAIVLDRFRGDIDWTISSQFGRMGSSRFTQNNSGGRLRFDFRDSPGYLGVRSKVLIPGNPLQFEMQVYGSLEDHPLVLRLVDSQGEHFQGRLSAEGEVPKKGVLKYSGNWMERDGWFSYDGDEDGVPDLPLYISEIIVDSAEESEARGDISLLQLSAITLAKKEECMRISFPQGDYLFFADESKLLQKYHIPVNIDNLLNEELAAQAELEILDPDSVRIAHTYWNITVPPLSRLEEQIAIEPNRRGWFKIILSQVGQEPVEQRFAITAKRDSTPPEQDSPFGMGIYLGNRYFPDERRKAAALAAQAGVKWSREEFSWSWIQPEGPDDWDWKRYDDAVKVANDNNIQLLGLLDYSTDWSSTAPGNAKERNLWMPQLEPWSAFNERTVARYGKSIKHWEIWNEPNGVFWRPVASPGDYLHLLKTSHETIKWVDPEAKILGLSTAGTDFHFIEEVLKLGGGDYFDIVAVHPYRYPNSPESSDFIGEMKRLKDLLAHYNCDKPIWITEIGWPSHHGSTGVSESIQAAMLVRTYVLAYTSGLVDKIFWYDYRNDGLDPEDPEQNFGILYRDFLPKSAYLAYKTMSECVAGRVFDGTVDLGLGPDVHAYAFRGDADRVLMVWSDDGNKNCILEIGMDPVNYRSLCGRKRMLTPENAKVVLAISEEPIFLSNFTTYPTAVLNEFKRTPEGKIEMCQGDALALEFAIPDLGSEDFSGDAFIEATEDIQLQQMTVPLKVEDGSLKFQVIIQAASDALPGQCSINAELYKDTLWIGTIREEIEVVAPVAVSIYPKIKEPMGLTVQLTNRFNHPLPIRILVDGFPLLSDKEIPVNLASSGEHTEFFQASPDAIETGLYRTTVEVKRNNAAEPIVKQSSISLASAPRLFSPPILDGNLGDWHRVNPIVLNDGSQYRRLTSDWSGENDLSAEVFVAWDADNLFLSADVLDASFCQPQSKGEVWKGDGIQFAISPYGSEGYAEVGLTLTEDGPRVWRWHDLEGIVSEPLEEGQLVVQGRDDGMVYECAVPWQALGIEPSRGDMLQFEVMINDNDGAGRKGWIEWAGGIGQNKTADAFGTLTLK